MTKYIITFSLGGIFGMMIANFLLEQLTDGFSWNYGFTWGVICVLFFMLLERLIKKI